MKIDVSRINIAWFTSTFNTITTTFTNGEIACDIEMRRDHNNLDITFGVDCGKNGYHRYNKVKITDKGEININLSGWIHDPIIESQLSKSLINKITIKNE